MQVEQYLERDDRVVAADRLDRAARLPLAGDRCDPGRAGRGRGGRAARRPGAARSLPVRAGAVLRRVSRQHDPARSDLLGGAARPARLASPPGLPPDRDRQRARRQLAGHGVIREWVCQPRPSGVQVLFHSWYNAPQHARPLADQFDADHIARRLGGELPVDPAGRRRAARGASRSRSSPRPHAASWTPRQVRELRGDGIARRRLRAAGRGHAGGLAGGRGRGPRRCIEDGWVR